MKSFCTGLFKSDRRFLWVVVLCALLIRTVYVLWFADRWNFFDTIHYDQAAQSLLRGEGFGPSLHFYGEYKYYCLEPIYPLFLAFGYALFGHSFPAVRMLQVLLGLVQIVMLFAIAKRMRDPLAGRIAQVLAAVYPFFIFISGLLYVTQLFSFLLTAMVWALMKYYERPNMPWLSLSALMAILATLANPVFLPGLFLLIIWIAAVQWKSWKTCLRHVAIFSLLIILGLTPWTVRNYCTFGIMSPGRACLAETRFLYQMSIKLREKRANTQAYFGGQSFTVHKRRLNNNMVFDCYLDRSYLLTLAPLQPIAWDTTSHYSGLLFYGGTPLQLGAAKIGKLHISGTDTLTNWILDSAISQPNWQSSEGVSWERNKVICAGAEKKWQYAAVFAQKTSADAFQLEYPNLVLPEDVRRMAVLFNLDQYSLHSSGYMIWLPSWKVADIWRIENGKPVGQIECQIFHYDTPYQKYFSIYRTIYENPLTFATQHFWPAFLNFWSPFISGVDTEVQKPSPWMQAVSAIFFAPLLLFGIVGAWSLRKQLLYLTLLIIPLWTLSFGYSLFFTQTRYRIPIDGFLILFAALGIQALWPKGWKKKGLDALPHGDASDR